MDDLVTSIKKRLSVDNLVEMMKDAKVIEGEKEEQSVRKSLENVNTDELINVNDLATKLSSFTSKGLPTSAVHEPKKAKEVEKNLDYQRHEPVPDYSLPQGQTSSNTVVESENSEPEKRKLEKGFDEDNYFSSFLE